MESIPNAARSVEPAGLLAPKETSLYLGIPVPTLAGWRHYKRGPTYVKIGGQIRYRKADLDAYIAQNERRAVSA